MIRRPETTFARTAGPVVLVARCPARLQSESVRSPQLTGVGELVAHTDDDHAPGDARREVDAVDLERRPLAERRRAWSFEPSAERSRTHWEDSSKT